MVPSEVLYFVLPCYVLSLVESLQAELFDTSTECVLLQYPSCYILIYSLLRHYFKQHLLWYFLILLVYGYLLLFLLMVHADVFPEYFSRIFLKGLFCYCVAHCWAARRWQLIGGICSFLKGLFCCCVAHCWAARRWQLIGGIYSFLKGLFCCCVAHCWAARRWQLIGGICSLLPYMALVFTMMHFYNILVLLLFLAIPF